MFNENDTGLASRTAMDVSTAGCLVQQHCFFRKKILYTKTL